MGAGGIGPTRRRLFVPRSVAGDLPSLRRLSPEERAATGMFSTAPERNVGQVTIDQELPQLPDDRLIATLVDLGCPRFAAEQVRTSGSWRFAAVSVWCLVRDAEEGKMVQNAGTGEWHSAKELVDAMRDQYAEARMVELISDKPDHTIGLWER